MLLSRVSMLVAPPTLARSAARWQVGAPTRRLLSNQTRSAETRRAARRATLRQQVMAPAGEGGGFESRYGEIFWHIEQLHISWNYEIMLSMAVLLTKCTRTPNISNFL